MCAPTPIAFVRTLLSLALALSLSLALSLAFAFCLADLSSLARFAPTSAHLVLRTTRQGPLWPGV